MSRRSRTPTFGVASWTNIFILILGITTIIYIYNPSGVFWLRGLAYTFLVLGAIWIVMRGLGTRMSLGREAVFVVGGILVGYAMMQAGIQEWFHTTIPFALTPLGLTDTSSGQLLVQNWWLIIALLVVLVVGIYLTPKDEPGVDFR